MDSCSQFYIFCILLVSGWKFLDQLLFSFEFNYVTFFIEIWIIFLKSLHLSFEFVLNHFQHQVLQDLSMLFQLEILDRGLKCKVDIQLGAGISHFLANYNWLIISSKKKDKVKSKYWNQIEPPPSWLFLYLSSSSRDDDERMECAVWNILILFLLLSNFPADRST